MKLMTKELERQFERAGIEREYETSTIICKFFNPGGLETWYASEFNGIDLFFGVVKGFEVELGYFSLSELQNTKGKLGLGIERDLHFTPRLLSEVQKILLDGGIV